MARQVDDGPAQQVDVAGQGFGLPGRAGAGRCGVRFGVGQDVEHQLSGGPVDGGVVVLGQHRPVAVVEAVDDVHLPQRPAPVHRAADDARHLVGQLVDHSRTGQMDFADVEVEIEVRVVHPVRVVETQRHLDQSSAQRFEFTDEGGVLRVDGAVRIELLAGPLEDHQPGDVTEGRRRLQVEEGGVHAAELLHECSSPRRFLALSW